MKPALPYRCLITAAVSVIAALTLPLIMYLLHMRSMGDVAHWLRIFTGSYFVNAGISLFLLFLLYLLLNSLPRALCALTIGCALFSIIDMQKMRILHQPFLPGDVLFLRQGFFVIRSYAGGALLGCAVVFLFTCAAIALRGRIPRCRLPLNIRLSAATVCSLLIVVGICNYRPVITALNSRFSIVDEFWNQVSNYRKNGVLYGFMLNLESLKITRPRGYSRQSVDRLFPDCTPSEQQSDSCRPRRPDVIICMNESFWDITRITAVSPSADPIPHFRSLCSAHPSFNLVSPVFGGNTCNAEFEVLTGMPNSFFPPGIYTYNQFIHHRIPSIVHLFRANGYRTIGIHTFKRWFWNRVNVYRHLGFHEFLTEESMEKPQKRGKFIGDEELVRQTIRQLGSDTLPHLIFALSMQNHGPYDEKRYATFTCPTATGLSRPADREYNNFVQGLADADRSLRILTDYIDTTSRPTFLLFFGDHLPGFSYLYNETGFSDTLARNPLAAHQTRALMYANFPLNPPRHPTLSMFYLPLILIRQTGITPPCYYRLCEEYAGRYPVFGRELKIDTTGTVVPPTIKTRDEENELWMLVYDALLGKQFADRYHFVPPAF